MENQILTEYLEKYTGNEYVYFWSEVRHNIGSSCLVYEYITICKILEKATIKYPPNTSAINAIIAKRNGRDICIYQDRPKKKEYIYVYSDMDERKKKELDAFVCCGLEVVDILGIDEKRMKTFGQNDSDVFSRGLKIGEIIDEYVEVLSITNLIPHLNNGITSLKEVIIKCLLEK